MNNSQASALANGLLNPGIPRLKWTNKLQILAPRNIQCGGRDTSRSITVQHVGRAMVRLKERGNVCLYSNPHGERYQDVKLSSGSGKADPAGAPVLWTLVFNPQVALQPTGTRKGKSSGEEWGQVDTNLVMENCRCRLSWICFEPVFQDLDSLCQSPTADLLPLS